MKMIVAILLFVVPAFANDPDHKPPVKTITVKVDAKQKQSQEQNQGQAQTQSQSANANNAQANSQTNETRVPRQAPPAVAPDSFPSAPCRVAFGAGASAPIGGLSVGGSKMDDECDKRETARAFERLGLREAAIKILCTTKAARKALGADCVTDSKRWSEEHPNFPY